MDFPLREIIMDITQHLTDKEWENIELQLRRAIR